jgi:hypothetical protein
MSDQGLRTGKLAQRAGVNVRTLRYYERRGLLALRPTTVHPTGRPTQSETTARSKHNAHGDLVTCSFDVTQTFPEGTVHFFGTATGFFTPAS